MGTRNPFSNAGRVLPNGSTYIESTPPRLSPSGPAVYDDVVFRPVQPHSPNGPSHMGPQLEMTMFPDPRVPFDPQTAVRAARMHPTSPIHGPLAASFSFEEAPQEQGMSNLGPHAHHPQHHHNIGHTLDPHNPGYPSHGSVGQWAPHGQGQGEEDYVLLSHGCEH